MAGRGRLFLRQALSSISLQDHEHIEVVVVDDSLDDQIESECREWAESLNVQYFRTHGHRGSASRKFNQAIDKCTGTIVKILCQDDVLIGPSSLSTTVKGFEAGSIWLVTAYAHVDELNAKIGTHNPRPHAHIERVNTIGSHSGLAFRRDLQHHRFDEKLFWRMDCELYRRLFDNYGLPSIIREETVGVRQWQGQSTNQLIGVTDRLREWLYVVKRYPRKIKHLG